MNQRQNGADAELPFEPQPHIDHDTHHGDQYAHDAVEGQFGRNGTAHRLGAPDLVILGNRVGHLLHRCLLGSFVTVLRADAHQHVRRRAELLDLHFADPQIAEPGAEIADIGFAVIGLQFNGAAAGKVDAQIEPARSFQRHCADQQNKCEGKAELAPAHERQLGLERQETLENVDLECLGPPVREPRRHQKLGHQISCEHRGQHTDRQRHGKTLHRPRAKEKQHHGGDQRGDIGVDDCRHRPLEARIDCLERRSPRAKLFAYALENQHVGIDRHTHRKHDAGDTRKRERRAQRRKRRKDHADIEHQRDIGKHPEQPVGRQHEQHHARRADEAGGHTSIDRICPQARAHGAFFNHIERSWKRAGPQQNRKIARRFGGEIARNLSRTTGNRLLDRRRGYHLPVEHDGEAAPDILRGDFTERDCALGVEPE